MRFIVVLLWTLLSMTAAKAQLSIGISTSNVSIGVSVPLYPELVRVPGHPVYYAPRLQSNFFFYEGMYWVYEGDDWYASNWYNGPWGLVSRQYVPFYVLRVPVRYYRNPPMYFRAWRPEAPPRWGEHWGRDWERNRSGWDKWDRRSVPAPAPLPVYQRKYSGDRYPQPDQQPALHSRNYRYEPREAVVRKHYQDKEILRPAAPAQRVRQDGPAMQDPRRQPHPAAAQPEQTKPGPAVKKAPQGKGSPDEQEKDRGKGDERNQGRNR